MHKSTKKIVFNAFPNKILNKGNIGSYWSFCSVELKAYDTFQPWTFFGINELRQTLLSISTAVNIWVKTFLYKSKQHRNWAQLRLGKSDCGGGYEHEVYSYIGMTVQDPTGYVQPK